MPGCGVCSMDLKTLRLIRSPQGYAVVPIHYTADEEKRTMEWFEQERKKYVLDADWDKEMEIDFRSVSGTPAYPNFSPANLKSGLEYNPLRPLCLCCDFNVDPMVWPIAQIAGGIIYFINEISRGPTNITDMVMEFRDIYPNHGAEIWVYGDATSTRRTAQTAKSDYDLMKLAFRGYSSSVVYKIPNNNPAVRDRLNAFNNRLKGPEGEIGILIDPDKCPELVQDLNEVIMRPDGKETEKSFDRRNPYHRRTHASDGGGYFISREWPVSSTNIDDPLKKKQGFGKDYSGKNNSWMGM